MLVRLVFATVVAALLAGCVVRARPARRAVYHCHAGVPKICHVAAH